MVEDNNPLLPERYGLLALTRSNATAIAKTLSVVGILGAFWEAFQFFYGQTGLVVPFPLAASLALLCFMGMIGSVLFFAPIQRRTKAIIMTVFVAGAIALHWGQLVKRYKREMVGALSSPVSISGFASEFPLGYLLVSPAGNELFDFQSSSEVGLMVDTFAKVSFSVDGDVLNLHLPNVNLRPNMDLHGTTIVLKRTEGNSITLRLDPKSFARGIAIEDNTFEKQAEPPPISIPEPSTEDVVLTRFPGSSQIGYVNGSTVVWGNSDSFQMKKGESLGLLPGTNMVRLDGGILRTARADVFIDAFQVQSSRFIGGPRGGYAFPKASVIQGNIFFDSIFDGSRLQDGAIINANKFVSSSGVYRIGAQPEVSFVVRIIKNGILFGAKPFKDEE